jgi:hypothetical protein
VHPNNYLPSLLIRAESAIAAYSPVVVVVVVVVVVSFIAVLSASLLQAATPNAKVAAAIKLKYLVFMIHLYFVSAHSNTKMRPQGVSFDIQQFI